MKTQNNRTKVSASRVQYYLLFIFVCAVCIAVGGAFFRAGSKAQSRENLLPAGAISPLSAIEPEAAKSMMQHDAAAISVVDSSDNLWNDVTESSLPRGIQALIKPRKYRSVRLVKRTLETILRRAPLEFTAEAENQTIVLHLPLPDGKFGRFKINESPIMSEELAAQYPDVKSYNGQGIDDPNATMRLSWTPQGFTAFVITRNGSFMVTPYAKDNQEYYMSYFTHDIDNSAFECLVRNAETIKPRISDEGTVNNFTGAALRHYRLIVSVNQQLYFASGNNDAGAVSTVNSLVNAVNAIYEREATIRFVIQNYGFDRLGTVFPPDQNLGQMAERNQQAVDNTFGNGAYDVSQVLGFNQNAPSGVVLNLSAVCNAPIKGRGATIVTPNLSQSAVVFSHELGHMFNARHTFTSVIGSCGSQLDSGGMVEPGTGSTIMSYAGLCFQDNLQSFNSDYFHVTSLLRIVDHADNVFPACGTRTATGNSPPNITGATGVNANIPANTPFTFIASATDPNGDPITYDWEQIDSGIGAPILRSYPPVSSSSRTFPSLPFILNNANVPPTFTNGFLTGEVLPNSTRTLSFAVTARDNRTAGGGTSTGWLQVFVRGDAGPFAVTQPNTNITWSGNSQQTITWNVANTNLAPINTANVRILLSTNGGQTFPTVLVDSTPNDGSQTVTIPNIPTTMARIKIEAINNIYFDISNSNFTISQGGNTIAVTVQTNPAGRSFTVDGTTYTTTQVFNWMSGSLHTIATASPQNGGAGTQYVWTNWSDGGLISHTVAPTTPATYTANFTTQYQLTMNAGAGGTVSPASGFFNAGQNVNISAAPNAGFAFNGWTGSGSGSYTGPNNPSFVTMNAPITETASFAAVPCSYSINPASQSFPAGGGNGTVQVTAPGGCGWTAVSNSLIDSNRGNASLLNLSSGVDLLKSTSVNFSANSVPNIAENSLLETNENAVATPAFGEDFENITTLPASGWFTQNNSSPVGTVGWFQGTTTVFPAQSGAGYIGANFNNTTGTNTISNWLLTPNITFNNGDVIRFWTRTATDSQFPDRLEVRLSTNGTSTNVGSGSTAVGDFATLLLSVNSSLTVGGYPQIWTQYTVTISGLSAPTSGRMAFRYFVTNGGPTGANSNYIGIDNFSYTPATPTSNWITITSGANGSGSGTVQYSVAPNNTGVLRTGTMTIAGQTFTVNQLSTNTPRRQFDFDGDGKADLAVFRPSNGYWYIINSSNGSLRAVQFGVNGDLIAPADYDGDGKTDICVFRPSNGSWYRLNSANDSFYGIQFGVNGDLPAPGDFDGDGKADITVYRPSTGSWYRLNSSNGQFVGVQFGVAEDKPIVGDFDGDGRSDITVWRPSNGSWYRLNSSNGQFVGTQFGALGDKPAAADFDGDGRTDLAVYRPSNGYWYVIQSSSGAFIATQFGIAEDKAAPADFDGDGLADRIVFRPSNGTWYLLRTQAGFTGMQFGANGDVPIPSAFVR